MKAYFYELADFVKSKLVGNEGFTLWLAGEYSDFVRFNHGKVRQAGHVQQAYLTLRLVQGQKHISQEITLSGDREEDQVLVLSLMEELRDVLMHVAEDPYLLLSDTVVSSEQQKPSLLPDSGSMVNDIVRLATGTDLVGILASGEVFSGFANDLGQRNWHQSSSWNFDWSLYSHGDKAVKRGSAGFQWSPEEIRNSVTEAQQQLSFLSKPARSIKPGGYRAYLTPAAVAELLDMLNWGGVSEKAFRTKQSPLEKLSLGEKAFSTMVQLNENVSDGLAPAFQHEGFIRPAQVSLVKAGKMTGTLISPRTAKEYGLVANSGCNESAQSFDMAAGNLAATDVLKALDTGLFISNLWYLNFSDRASCRVTGMTRFACFWVENGNSVAPLNVMRFVDSLYRLLGSALEALTQEQEFLADTGTYGGRSSSSKRVPGALLSNINLVL